MRLPTTYRRKHENTVACLLAPRLHFPPSVRRKHAAQCSASDSRLEEHTMHRSTQSMSILRVSTVPIRGFTPGSGR